MINLDDKNRESTLQSQCEGYLNRLKAMGLVFWFHDRDARMNEAGLPDLVVIKLSKSRYKVKFCGGEEKKLRKREVLFIELKKFDGKPKEKKLEPSQVIFKSFFDESFGEGTYYLIDVWEDFHELFKEYGIEVN